MKIKSILIALVMGVGMLSGIAVGMDTPSAQTDVPQTDQPAANQPVATQPAMTWADWFNNIKGSIVGKTPEEQKSVTDGAKAVWNAIPESVKSVGGGIAQYYVVNWLGGPTAIAGTALSGAWTVVGWMGGPTAIAKGIAWNMLQNGLLNAYKDAMKNPEQNAVKIAEIKQESLQQMETRLANGNLYPTYWIQINALDDPDEFPCDKANTLCIDGKKQLRAGLATKISSLKTQDPQEFERQADINGEVVELRKNFPGYKTDFRGYISYIDSVIKAGISDQETMLACLSEKGRTAAKAVARKVAEGGAAEVSEEDLMGVSSRRRATQPVAQTPTPSAQLQPVYVPATRTTTQAIPSAPTLQFMTEELSPEETAQFRQVMEAQSPTNRGAIVEYMRRLKENNPDEMVRYVKRLLATVPAPRVPQFEPVPTNKQTAAKRSPSPAPRGRSRSGGR